MDNMIVGQGELQGDELIQDPSKGAYTMVMRNILRVLFVMAFVALLVNTAKIAYQGWFGKREPVLAKYEEPQETADLSAYSLTELTKRYEAARKAVQAYEIDENTPAVEDDAKRETEPYASEYRLKDAVERREYQEGKIHEVRYYCLLGVGLILAGTLFFTRFNELLGIALLITGFGEMIGYAAPDSLHFEDFDGIRGYKMIFSAVAMLLLLFSAYVTGALSAERSEVTDEVDAPEGSAQE